MDFNPAWLTAAALIAEGLTRWPSALPHPVMGFGKMISGLERRWNEPKSSERRKKILGAVTLLILITVAVLSGLAIHYLASLLPRPLGTACLVLAGLCGLAAGSLWHHVRAIQIPLSRSDLPTARQAVGMIVGRDTQAMTESDVAAAAIESLAESFNDGVVAPVFWFVVAGLPGLFAYKAINTADSMIGHMEPRWRSFGWAAARTDDLVNLIPARLAGGLLVFAGWICGNGLSGTRVMLRDARKHASPNAGWTEAAMAGLLRIRLGGTVRYDELESHRPCLGEGPAPVARDLKRALQVYVCAGLCLLVLLLGGGLLWPR